jgi:hypothetical protein
VTLTIASLIFDRWLEKQFENNVRHEYLNSRKDYFLDNGSLNYTKFRLEIAEKRISNEKIVFYWKLKRCSYLFNYFLLAIVVATVVFKFSTQETMPINTIIISVFVASVIYKYWLAEQLKKNVRREYLNSRKDYFLDDGSLDYRKIRLEILEKRISNEIIIFYWNVRKFNFLLMCFMFVMIVINFVFKFLF